MSYFEGERAYRVRAGHKHTQLFMVFGAAVSLCRNGMTMFWPLLSLSPTFSIIISIALDLHKPNIYFKFILYSKSKHLFAFIGPAYAKAIINNFQICENAKFCFIFNLLTKAKRL